MSEQEQGLRALLSGNDLGVLAAIKRDGRPQLSTVNFTYDDARSLVRISSIADRAKVHNLRRDPRGSLHVTGDQPWFYAVAEGTVSLSGVAAERDDEVVEELVDVYRAIRGDHPDWDDYRRAMVEDRRLVIRLHVERVYGAPPPRG